MWPVSRSLLLACVGAMLIAGCRDTESVDWEASPFVWAVAGDDAGDFFGRSVAGAGDVDGDGFDDVIVGAPLSDDGAEDAGAAYLFRGGPAGLSLDPRWTYALDQAGARFGEAVAGVGDVDDDGFDDVVVGAPLFDEPSADDAGAVYLFRGNAGGLETEPSWTFSSGQAGARMGAAVDGAGDVDDDGFADVIVGLPQYDDGQTDEGGAWIFLGEAGGLEPTPTYQLDGNQAGATFGASVSGAGDLDADGVDEIVIGAPRFDGTGGEDHGAVFVFRGAALGGLTPGAAWMRVGSQPQAELGASVTALGDLNDDGFDDIAVGSYAFDDGQTDEGAVFVFRGTTAQAGTVESSPVWSHEGDQNGAFLGFSVAGGDLDGDGLGDLFVGSHGFDRGQPDEGAAFFFLGSLTSELDAGGEVESNQSGCIFGASVANAGDVDGDGRDEVMIGAYGYDTPAQDAGRVFLYPLD